MKNYKITEQQVNELVEFCMNVPTRWGRQIQDFIRGLEEIKEEAKEEIKPNLEEEQTND